MMTRASAAPAVADAQTSVRLDLWLWAARFFKTRSVARQAVENGKVAIGGERPKPSRAVRVGDALRIERGEEAFEIEVMGLSDSRGPASVARLLYSESEASRQAREARLAELRAQRAGYSAPETRPDKRARRLIRALGDIDAS
ncbi:RNA-binding S4 domain-containing protein [Luteimonas sp. YGD11-2]|uniref:RNA-binding S4 domain-containing protein n=1 Tax=Luteimonas sp. YGD11-2 TaxID=2508168 RepID=UPI001F509BE6|nr:RNA-binding S4 domain-containing protein [Luteimonas sp. YGD11-2]